MRAAVFDARIVYTDPRPLPTSEQRRLAARPLALPELLATSDVVLPLVPLTGVLVDAYGWRTTLVILAGTLAVVTIPIHVGLLRR